MRTRRFITAGAATAATLMLLAASPHPTNASPNLAQDTTSNPGITALTDAVIASVVSRAEQNPTPTGGNAVELRNPTATEIDLNNASVQVFDSGSSPTASFNFGLGDVIPAGGSVLIRDPNFWPTPLVIPDSQIYQFTVAMGVTDAIEDSFGVALVDGSGNQIDSLATVSGISVAGLTPNAVGEGDPATPLGSGTDPFNAAIRRDVVYTDTDDNRDDFQRRPAMWAIPL